MTDYEQLYYDAQYEIKKLNKRIEDLEADLALVSKSDKNKLNLKREILKEFYCYKNSKSEEVKENEEIQQKLECRGNANKF